MVKRVRPVENISVRVLTHENNATTVASLGEVLPGDIIRTLNGNHVLLVSEVGYGKKGNPLYIKYINSTEYAGIKYGIREGVIVVTEPTGHILQQEWIDGDADINLTYKAAKDYPEDTRIVRLKLLHTS